MHFPYALLTRFPLANSIWKSKSSSGKQVSHQTNPEPGMAAHTCDPRAHEAKAREFHWTWGQPGLPTEFQTSLGYRVRPCFKQTELRKEFFRINGEGGRLPFPTPIEIEDWGCCCIYLLDHHLTCFYDLSLSTATTPFPLSFTKSPLTFCHSPRRMFIIWVTLACQCGKWTLSYWPIQPMDQAQWMQFNFFQASGMNQRDELRHTSLLLLRGHQKEIVNGHLSAKGGKSLGQEKGGGKRAMSGADMVRIRCVLWNLALCAICMCK